MDIKTFQFQTFHEAKQVALEIAEYAPHASLATMGLSEIFINAIEHGNLGINYEDKAAFQNIDVWFNEVKRRLLLVENKDKFVQVDFQRCSEKLQVLVRDHGNGFDWEAYDSVDKINQTNRNGRGIIIARELGFDELNYKAPGNEVECILFLNRLHPLAK